MRRGRAALLAVVVALAGCTGGFGYGGQATPTVTPAPVPGDPVGPNGELSPGIGPDDVDVSTMAWTHARALDGHTYRFTLWENRTVNVDGEMVWQRANETRGIVAADGTYLLTRVIHRTDGDTTTRTVTMERYSDGVTEFQRFSGFTVRYFPNRHRVDEAVVFPLLTYAPTNSSFATDYVRDGHTYVRVFGYGGAPPSPTNASNYQMNALVRPGGMVEQFEASYTDRSGPRTVFVTVRVSYDSVDEVGTVPPPVWYEPGV
jgi:hypothetical protein